MVYIRYDIIMIYIFYGVLWSVEAFEAFEAF